MNKNQKVYFYYQDFDNKNDRDSIIRLWRNNVYEEFYKTGICLDNMCDGAHCKFSHIKIDGIQAKRCSECASGNCKYNYAKITTIYPKFANFKGTLDVYNVCKGLARDLEDQKIDEEKRKQNMDRHSKSRKRSHSPEKRKQKSPSDDPRIRRKEQKVINNTQLNTKPTTTITKPTTTKPTTTNPTTTNPTTTNPTTTNPTTTNPRPFFLSSGEQLVNLSKALNKINPNELKPLVIPTITYDPNLPITPPAVIKNEANIRREHSKEILKGDFIYINADKTNKNVILDLVSNEDFRGMVKIAVPHLQTVVLKLAPETIVALQSDIIKIPYGAAIVNDAKNIIMRRSNKR